MGIPVSEVIEVVEKAKRAHDASVVYTPIAVENDLTQENYEGLDLTFKTQAQYFSGAKEVYGGAYCELAPNEDDTWFGPGEAIVYGTYIRSVLYSRCNGGIIFTCDDLEADLVIRIDQATLENSWPGKVYVESPRITSSFRDLRTDREKELFLGLLNVTDYRSVDLGGHLHHKVAALGPDGSYRLWLDASWGQDKLLITLKDAPRDPQA